MKLALALVATVGHQYSGTHFQDTSIWSRQVAIK